MNFFPNFFSFFQFSRTLSNLTDLGSSLIVNEKGRWGFPANSLLLYMSSASLTAGLKSMVLHHSRSRILVTSGESSTLASLMARDLPLGPSVAPCQVETSMAHGDLFSRASVFVSAANHVQSLLSPNLFTPAMPNSLQIFPSSTPASRNAFISPSSTKSKLGFCLVGLGSDIGPLTLLKPMSNNIKTRASPASLLHALLTPRGTRTTHDEAFVQTCAHFFKSEICVSIIHRSTGSEFLSVSIRRNLAKSSATNLISAPESLRSVCTPVPLPPATHLSTPIFSSSLHSRHTITIAYKDVNLGFHFLGILSFFGPLNKSQPIFRSSGPTPLNDWPRSAPSFYIPSLLHLLLRFPELCGRGHHLRWESTSMNWACVYHLGTLLQISILVTISKSINLMILDRRCDFSHGTSRFIYYKPAILSTGLKYLTITNTSTTQIILPQRTSSSSMRDPELLFRASKLSLSDYESLPNLYPSLNEKPWFKSFSFMEKLYFSPSSYLERTLFTSFRPRLSAFKPCKHPIFITFVILCVEHLAPARIKVLKFSSTSLCQSTVTITSPPEILVEVLSTRHGFARVNLLYSFCLQALMDHKSDYFIYRYVALENAFLFMSLTFGSLNPSYLCTLIWFVSYE